MHRRHIKCLVCGISEKAKIASSQQIRFYGVPHNKNKRRSWLTSINRSDLLNKKISPDLQICEQHFMSDMIVPNTSRLKLTTSAIPSPIIIKKEIETELSYQENENTWQPLGTPNKEVVSYTVLEDAATGLSTTNSDLNKPLGEEETSQLETAMATVKTLKQEVLNLKREVTYYQGKDFFLKQCKEILSPNFSSIVENELRNISYDRNGKRFSEELKKFCLNFNSISPTAYSFLSKIVTLPNKRTLSKFKKKCPSDPAVEDSMPIDN